jgi:hypothetical protein
MEHRTIDWAIYLLDADRECRRNCKRICYNIEKELSSWIGELQFEYLKKYRAGWITKFKYMQKITELTQNMNTLVATALLRRDMFDERKS